MYYGSPGLFLALVTVLVLIAGHEYFSMIARIGVVGFPRLGLFLSVLLLLVFYFDGRYFPEWAVLAVFSLFAAWMVRENNVKLALDQISYTLLGVVYVAGLGGFYLLIRNLEQGREWIFFLFLVVWLGDTAAYYVGRHFGEKAFAPLISPKKTMEGSLAGLAGSMAGGALAAVWLLDTVPLSQCLLAALICGMIGQLGDLAESLLKRSTGVKDSGGLIPGHGGILDRIDSLLFAGPAFYVFSKLIL